MSGLKGLLRILTLRCDAASELSSRELDERLPRLDRAALFCHLLACNSCRRFRRQIGLIREAIELREQHLVEDNPNEDGLSEEARNRIALAIQRLARDEPGNGTITD